MMQKSNRRLLLISHHNSYRIAPYIKAAINLGLEVTIASEGKHSLVSEVANGIHVNFSDRDLTLEKILEENSRHRFAGVLGSDDQTVELAAYIARDLGLPHNPPRSANYTRRKDLARTRLSETGCSVPFHKILKLSSSLDDNLDDLPWPCVLKPLNMSASRGVIRADDKKQFIAAAERLQNIISESDDEFERTHILIEEYIDGYEIAFEGYLQDGVLKQIAIFDKPEPLCGPYFAETIYITPSSLHKDTVDAVEATVQQACQAYGLVTGAVHAECRIDKNNRTWILEIATRTIGGDCARTLDQEDFNLEELAVRLAINEHVESNTPEQIRAVMMLPVTEKGMLRRVEGLLDARKVEHIDMIDIVISEGHEVIPLPEGNQYLGYIFASGNNRDPVLESIHDAYSRLKFIIVPIFAIASS